MVHEQRAICERCGHRFRVCIMSRPTPAVGTTYEAVCPACRRASRFRVTEGVRRRKCDGRLPIARQVEPI